MQKLKSKNNEKKRSNADQNCYSYCKYAWKKRTIYCTL